VVELVVVQETEEVAGPFGVGERVLVDALVEA
jgi:hypothetical protein